MQSGSPDHADIRRSLPKTQPLTLSMASPIKQTSPSQGLSLETSITSDGSASPTQPTWSPLTPTLSQADFPQVEETRQQQQHQHDANTSTGLPDGEVAPQPLSLDENPDAIALRNAISILQIQRQQSVKDIQSLERLRQAAIDDPQGFLAELKDNKLAQAPRLGLDVDEDSVGEDGGTSGSKFGTIPQAQNVVRCPPVNWDKYHVVGDSLDRLHEQQRRYPGVTEAQIQRSGHPPKHTVAAPYRPGIDRLEEKTPSSHGKIP